MPAVSEQFVSEFVVSGYSAFQSAMRGADRMMGNLEQSGLSAGGVLSHAIGQTLGNVATRTAGAIINGFGNARRAVTGFVRDGVSLSDDFETSLVDLQIAGKGVGLTYDTLRGASIAVGGDTDLLGVSATGAAESITGLLKSGLSAEVVFGDLNGYLEGTADLGGALRAAIDLAAASQLDMVQASDLGSVALASFGSEIESDAKKAEFINAALDNMVRAADASVAEVPLMAESLKMVGPSASAANQSIQDVNQGLALLSERNIQGSMAGTSLGSMFNSLRDPTTQAAEALDHYKIGIRDVATGEMLALPDLIANFSGALGDVSAAERDAALGAIFTTQGMRAMDTFIQGGPQKWDDMSDSIANAAGIQEQAAAKSKTYQARLEAFQGTMETFQIQIGDALKPVRTQILTWAGELVEQWGPQVITFFERLGGALEGFVGYIKLVVQDGDLLNDWLTHLPPAVQPIVQALGGFILFLQDLRNGVVGVDYPWEDVFPPVIADAIYTIIDAVTGLWAAVGPFITLAWEWISQNVELQDVLIGLGLVIANTVIPAIGVLIGTIASFLGPILLVIAGVALLRTAWEENFLGIQDALRSAWEVVQPVLQALWEWLQVAVPAALQFLQTLWVDTVWPAIASAIQTVWPVVQSIFAAIVTFVMGTLIPAVQSLYTKWVNEVWPTIQTVTQNVWNVISTVFQEIGRWINDNIVPWIEALRAKWADDVWPAIQTALETAWAAIEPIWTSIKEWLGVTLPPIIEGLQTTFETVMSAIEDAIQPVKEAIDKLKTAAEGFWNWITSHTFKFKFHIPDLPSWATPGSPLPIHTAWKAFLTYMQGVRTTPIVKFGEAIGQGLIDNIKEGAETTQDLMGNLLSAASKLSAIGSTYSGFYEDRVLNPIAEHLKELGPKIDDNERELEGLADSAQALGDEMLAILMQEGGPQEAMRNADFARMQDELLDITKRQNSLQDEQNGLLSERNGLEEKQAALTERMTRLQKAQSDLKFLQDQVKLLDLITEHGLDAAEVFQGMQLGMEASTEGLIDATTRAMQLIIETTNDELGLHSPSRVMRSKGRMIGEGLMIGLLESLNPAAIQAQMQALVPGFNPLPAVSAYNVTNYNQQAFNLTTQSVTRPGTLRMEFEAMEAAGAIAA